MIKVERSSYTYKQNFQRNKGEYIGTTTNQRVACRGKRGDSTKGRQTSTSCELKMCMEPYNLIKSNKNSLLVNSTKPNDKSLVDTNKELQNIKDTSKNLKDKGFNSYSNIFNEKRIRPSCSSNFPVRPPHVKMFDTKWDSGQMGK